MVAAYCAQLAKLRQFSESVVLEQAAGKVLANALCADQDQPPFSRSTRDGFACRAQEASKHGFLRIVGAARAGDAPAAEGRVVGDYDRSADSRRGQRRDDD